MATKHKQETEQEQQWRKAYKNAQEATDALDIAVSLRLRPRIIATLRQEQIDAIKTLNEAFALCYPDIQKYYE